MADLADQIRDLLPHGTFDVRARTDAYTATILTVTCRCGRSLDWGGTLPGRLLLNWLTNHRDDIFLTDEQPEERCEKMQLAETAEGILAALGLPDMKSETAP